MYLGEGKIICFIHKFYIFNIKKVSISPKHMIVFYKSLL